MRLHDPLSQILDSRTKVAILRFLCHYRTFVTGRQLAQFIKINRTTVNEALNVLVDEQLILVRGAGKANIYELNRNRWIVTRLLEPLFKEEKKLFDSFLGHVSQEIEHSPLSEQIVSVALFGSVHEQREKPGSDIDIFAVVKEARYKNPVENLFFSMNNLQSWVGMGMEPYVKSIAELKRDRELAVIKSIFKSHRIIWGEKLEKIE
ncbi:MAG: winged helix-turn-helix transcriptional regulator [Candidatus Omnitrophica bacterium]|nr:winged helix-turn-helix transcriptional regulator [Candidatus Omnitrophota bacterium]MDE2231888.1 winged helix-turn-helix transcriptional regulator [Candidatus Omnitrophota bacterium]